MTLQSYGAQGGAASAAVGGGMGVAPTGPTILLASRAQRWVARFVDGALFLVGALIVAAAVELGSGEADGLSPSSLGVLLGGIAVVWLLMFPFALARFERTIGKALLGLRVVRMRNGKRIGFWRAVWRELFYLVISVVPLVGELNVLSCFWDKPYQQCWHDKVAGTITVDRRTFAAG